MKCTVPGHEGVGIVHETEKGSRVPGRGSGSPCPGWGDAIDEVLHGKAKARLVLEP